MYYSQINERPEGTKKLQAAWKLKAIDYGFLMQTPGTAPSIQGNSETKNLQLISAQYIFNLLKFLCGKL